MVVFVIFSVPQGSEGHAAHASQNEQNIYQTYPQRASSTPRAYTPRGAVSRSIISRQCAYGQGSSCTSKDREILVVVVPDETIQRCDTKRVHDAPTYSTRSSRLPSSRGGKRPDT